MSVDMSTITVIGQQNNRLLLDRLSAGAIENRLHLMLLGPSGHGKTNLAYYFARQLEMETIECLGSDIDSLIIALQNGVEGVIFIDEIHLIPLDSQEKLYKYLDTGRNLFIGATTDLDLLKEPLRNRFAVTLELESYSLIELVNIALKETSDNELAWFAVHIGQLVPRKILAAAKILRTLALEQATLEEKIQSILMMSTNVLGIDRRSRAYLTAIAHGKPMGVSRISGIVNEKRSTLEIDVEPYLLRQGFIVSTPRGRQITEWGLRTLELTDSMTEDSIKYLIGQSVANINCWTEHPYSLGRAFAL